MQNRNSWSRPPQTGDLVEVGWDQVNNEPFIGVVTEIRDPVFNDHPRMQAFGCVLVNGNPKWCDLYDLKPVIRKNHSPAQNE